MSAISVTAGNVLPGANAVATFNSSNVFGETVTAGQAVYQKASDGKFYKAQADTAAKATCVGIARNGGSAGQPAFFQTAGTIAIGGTTVAGTIYCVSAGTAGDIVPWADLATTNYVTILGVGDGTGNIIMGINVTGITHA